MELIEDEVFLNRAALGGIVPDRKYSSARPLTFVREPLIDTEWHPPCVPSDLEGFVSTLLRAASEEGPYWLYRKGGAGWYEDEESPLSDQIRNRFVATAGVPREFEGAIGLATKEWRDLLTIILAFYVFGWEVGGDLQVIPADWSSILTTSHHGPAKATFTDPQRLAVFERAMEGARFKRVERTA